MRLAIRRDFGCPGCPFLRNWHRRALRSSSNKQYGKQLLFVNASFHLNPGEKVGLVGPEGSGPGVWNIQSM
jgi:ABC-type multidrug transport system fused ATPase/permease subunit